MKDDKMSTTRRFITQVLLTCIGYSKDLEEKQKITFIIAGFGTTLLIMFLLLYIIVAPNPWLILETVIIFVAYLLTFPMLKNGHYTPGKMILIMGITLQVVLLVFVWFTKETYLVLFFFIVPPISFFVLDIRNKVEKKILLFVSMAICLIVILFSLIEPLELITLDQKYVSILRFMSVISTMISEILVFYFYVNSLDKTNNELLLLANTDSLTTASNRRKLFEVGEELFNLYKKHRQGFSLMILDIDHFKTINDTYGHPVGDEVLKELSSLIKKSIRKEDLLSRYGGEEFAILFKNLEGSNSVTMESIKERISMHTFVIDDHISIELTISAGVVTFSEDIKDFDDMVKKADELLYKAKQLGRNRIEYYRR